MNESSAVSDIIQRMRSRRLQTDPSDALLFAPATGAAPRGRRDQARWFDSSAVEPAPARAPQSVAPSPRAPNLRAQQPVARTTPERGRVGLLIVATIVAGALGIYGASRIKIGDDAPAASLANVAPVAAPTVEATLPAPVEHGAEAASATVTDTSFAPVATAQPTVAPPVDTTAPSAPTSTSTPNRHRTVKHKKVKRHKASTKHSIVQPAAVTPAPKWVAKPSRRAAQSADEESPL